MAPRTWQTPTTGRPASGPGSRTRNRLCVVPVEESRWDHTVIFGSELVGPALGHSTILHGHRLVYDGYRQGTIDGMEVCELTGVALTVASPPLRRTQATTSPRLA